MEKILYLLLIITLSFSQKEGLQEFKLKDGTIINGTIIDQDDKSFMIKTQYGSININKEDIIQKEYEVKLLTGETLVGTKLKENDTFIILRTKMGDLTIQQSDIKNLQEISISLSNDKSNNSSYSGNSYGVASLLFGANQIDKNIDFALGDEQLIDLFFDPTGYTLEKGALYFSGFSFGFGVTDKIQITSKWVGFFGGNLNIRPKINLYETGNWEEQHAFSIGTHIHSRWKSNLYEWKEGIGEKIIFNGEDVGCAEKGGYGSCWKQTAPPDTLTEWGGYYNFGQEIESLVYNLPDNYDPNAVDTIYFIEPYIENDYFEENYFSMMELFSAYTYSKARNGLRGRISHTLGGNVKIINHNNKIHYFPRIYYGLDIDINSKLKMISELFYDPSYLELWKREEYDNNDNTTNIEKPEWSPIHVDFGFMYALNESFRFGIHFQQPFIAIYWKL